MSLEEAFKSTIKRNLGDREAAILFDFVEQDVFIGEYFTRVPLCENHFRIDVLCVEGPKTKLPISICGNLTELRKLLHGTRPRRAWVLEIKETLNFEAIGQILVDKYYFPREYPNIPIQCFGILCRSTDKALEDVCKSHGIKMFEIKE